jgi:hypothetical protein
MKNDTEEEENLLPLFYSFSLEYSCRRVQVKQNGLKLNGTHQLLV